MRINRCCRRLFISRKPNNKKKSSDFSLKNIPCCELSNLTNKDAYRKLRIKEIDVDEFYAWRPQLVNILRVSDELLAPCEVALRRGVPDVYKRLVMLKVQGTKQLMLKLPQFYTEQLHHTFGTRIPQKFSEKVPTFSGGFLGVEEEIRGTPISVDQLEIDFECDTNRSEVSWTELGSFVTQKSAFRVRNDHSFYINSVRSGSLDSQSHRHFLDYLSSLNPPDDDYSKYNKKQLRLSSRKLPFLPTTPSKFLNSDKIVTRRLSKSANRTKTKTVDIPIPALNSEFRKQSQEMDLISTEPIDRMNKEGIIDSDNVSRASTFVAEEETLMNEFNDNINTDNNNFYRIRSSQNEFEQCVELDEPGKDVYRLENITYLHKLLNVKGLYSAKRLLWVISKCCHDIEFCPIIPNIVCIGLIYFTEEETFFLLYSILQKARDQIKRQTETPFLNYRRNDFVRYINLVASIAWKHLPKISARLQKLGIDVASWLAKHLCDGLVRTVPFNLLLRIYINFFFEGVQIFQRYAFAILKLNEQKLLQCENKQEAENLLTITRITSINQMNAITKEAFRLPVKLITVSVEKFSSCNVPTPYLTKVKMQQFHRPKLMEPSKILTDSEWEALWSWISDRARILDPKLCWCSDVHGCSMLAINRQTERYFEHPMLFVILTANDEVIGGYSPKHLSVSHSLAHYPDPSSSFLFVLRPTLAFYGWTGHNRSFIDFTPEHIIIGGNRIALWIDSNVQHGSSYESKSFNSPQLAGDSHGDFIVRCMEIWSLL